MEIFPVRHASSRFKISLTILERIQVENLEQVDDTFQTTNASVTRISYREAPSTRSVKTTPKSANTRSKAMPMDDATIKIRDSVDATNWNRN